MKLGIVISSNDPETAWNALRVGNHALGQGDAVSVFLLGAGVECEQLDTPRFAVTQEMHRMLDHGGHIRACGTCLKLRATDNAGVCDFSTMADLYRLIGDSDKLLTF